MTAVDANSIDFGGGPADGGIATASRDFTPGDGTYSMRLRGKGIRLTVDHLRRKWDELVGELTVTCSIPGARTTDVRGTILVADFNFSNLRAREERAKALQQRSQVDADWFGLLEDFCQRVLSAERIGQPAIHLRDVEPAGPEEYVDVNGLRLLTRHPVILFGDGGTGKSMIALHAGGQLAKRGLRVMLADWECDAQDHRDRLGRLFGADMPDILYARCDRPLVFEADRLRRIVTSEGINYLLLDSVAFASDGPPESAEAASAYFRALRSINVGSLNIAHINKSEQGDQKPFGSAFWANGARATWFVTKSGESGDGSQITLGLFNRKANTGPIRPASGLEVSFEADRTLIRNVDLADVADLASKLPLWQRMTSVLRRGPMTIPDLATELGAKTDSIAKAVNRSEGRIFTRITSDAKLKIALVERSAA